MKPQQDIREDEIRPSRHAKLVDGHWHCSNCIAVSLLASRDQNHVAELCSTSRAYGVRFPEKLAGKWPNMPDKRDRMACVLEQLGTADAIAVLDESGFPKRGKKSAGVKKQHCGVTGRVENCQVGVFLTYVTTRGHALIDRDLYLPEDWLNDRERCQEAGIADTVQCASQMGVGTAYA